MADRPVGDLLSDARAGRPEAVARLCAEFYPRILTYMRYRVDATNAEDLTSEVFVRVLRGVADQKGSFAAWVFTIAANVVVDHLRSRSARKEVAMNNTIEDAALAPAATPHPADSNADLAAAIAELTADQRELVTLKFINGLSNAEIAEATGKRPEAIRALQFRALMALRQILDRRTGRQS